MSDEFAKLQKSGPFGSLESFEIFNQALMNAINDKDIEKILFIFQAPTYSALKAISIALESKKLDFFLSVIKPNIESKVFKRYIDDVLNSAIVRNDLEKLKNALNSKSLDLQMGDLNRYLKSAMCFQKNEVVQFLLAHKRCNPVASKKQELLYFAIERCKDQRIFEKLLQLDFRWSRAGNLALECAIENNNDWLCLRLLQKQPVLEQLHSCSSRAQEKIAQLCGTSCFMSKHSNYRAQFNMIKPVVTNLYFGFYQLHLPLLLQQEMGLTLSEPFSNCIVDYVTSCLLTNLNRNFVGAYVFPESVEDQGK